MLVGIVVLGFSLSLLVVRRIIHRRRSRQFREAMKLLRLGLGIDIHHAAAMVGVDVCDIYDIEHPSQMPDLTWLHKETILELCDWYDFVLFYFTGQTLE